MRFVRFELDGTVRIGIISGEAIVDIADIMPEFTRIVDIAAAGPEALVRLEDRLEGQAPRFALADVKLLAPIERPGKYLAIGMNYGKHLEEADQLGVPRSKHQIWFNKQTTSIVGPYDDIQTGVTEKLDYEVELGVVIGKPARQVAEKEAHANIFGYFVANDVSARDWQFHSQTIMMGKSFDTHGPIGPCIVTADEIPDPHKLGLRCYVNGELRQSGNTGDMLASIRSQIAYLSTAFTLETGDLIATGTPHGVGISMNPPTFLQPGDVVRCEIDAIGAIENRIAER